MIRAHMATFPARSALVPSVVESILPQVDRLFVVLNEYDCLPRWVQHDKIEAVIPEKDLKDAGKFFFTATADDFVFLVDDDIAYPLDYVERTLAAVGKVGGLGENCVGYFANALKTIPGDTRLKWSTYNFDAALGRYRAASLLGTGTALCSGEALPCLEQMRQFIGMCDLGFARHQLHSGRQLWALPSDAGWLRSKLTDDLSTTALYNNVHNPRDPKQRPVFRELALGWAHAGMSYGSYRKTIKASAEDGEPKWSN